jgi:hypothetical protein
MCRKRQGSLELALRFRILAPREEDKAAVQIATVIARIDLDGLIEILEGAIQIASTKRALSRLL